MLLVGRVNGTSTGGGSLSIVGADDNSKGFFCMICMCVLYVYCVVCVGVSCIMYWVFALGLQALLYNMIIENSWSS